MKLKAAIRYQAVELVQCAAVFCLVIGAIVLVVGMFSIANEAHFMVSAMGVLPYVFMPLLALSVYACDTGFLLRMGLTRSQVLASTAASFAAACLLLALVEAACAAVIPQWALNQSLFLMGHGPQNGPLLDFLFMFLGCAAASAVGLAFAALQMRFGTRRVVLIALAVLIVTSNQLNPRAVSDGWAWLFALTPGASLANPFVFFVAVTALGLLVTWAVSRRYEVR